MPASRWQDEADFVVVGSGAGGATAALELARAGRDVLLLEEGQWITTADFQPDFFSALSRLWRDFGGQAARGRSIIPVAQGCCVGGSTTVNGAIMHRLPREVWERWAVDPGIGEALPWQQLQAHAGDIERELGIGPSGDPEREMLPIARTLRELGIGYREMARAAPGCRQTRRCVVGCPSGGKWSLERSFVPRALELGARLIANCRVERLVVSGGRAEGIDASLAAPSGRGPRRRLAVRARRAVVVAAGAVHSPLLLRRSGLRNRHLGRHLQWHTGSNVVAEFAAPAATIVGAGMGFEVFPAPGIKYGSIQSTPPEILFANLPLVGRDLAAAVRRTDCLSIWNTSIACRSEGAVRRSPFGWPSIRLTPGPSDMQQVRAAAAGLVRLLFAAGATAVYPVIHGIPPVLRRARDAELVDAAPLDPRAYTLNCSHIFGTCRMASAASDGVVAPTFATHEAAGLYVVDASVFPSNIGANPQESIMTLARHAARHLAA